jgi:hypothetical protein
MGNAVPVGVMRATPLEDMPLVTPVRMFVLSGTNSLCTLLFGALLNASQRFVSWALPLRRC